MSEQLIRSAVRKALLDTGLYVESAPALAYSTSQILQLLRERLDAALSTRASEETLSAINLKLPEPTAAGNMPVALAEDALGVTQALSSIASRLSASLLAETMFSYDNTGGASAVSAPVFTTPPSVSEAGVLTIQFYLDTATTVELGITRGGAERRAALNSGRRVEANAWYEFAVSLAPGDAIQLYVAVPAGAIVNGYFALIYRGR